ncbi:MAG: shikimate kinase [Acidobacteriaceae bacterium]
MSGRAGSPGIRNISRVILTGFMGAGKTTVGALLAQRLGWDFADSDALVEAGAAMPVAEIFARRGEAAFRDLEGEAVRDACRRERLVLALGGGALERASTRTLLRELPGTRLVFLDAPLEVLVARCGAEASGPVRPVLRDRERLEERWRTRLPWYRQAHLTVDTREAAPEAVVERIVAQLEAGDGDEMGRENDAVICEQAKPGGRA